MSPLTYLHNELIARQGRAGSILENKLAEVNDIEKITTPEHVAIIMQHVRTHATGPIDHIINTMPSNTPTYATCTPDIKVWIDQHVVPVLLN